MPGWRMHASLVMSFCATSCTTVSDLEVIITHASRRKREDKVPKILSRLYSFAEKAWCAISIPVRRLGIRDYFGQQADSSIDVGVLVLELSTRGSKAQSRRGSNRGDDLQPVLPWIDAESRDRGKYIQL